MGHEEATRMLAAERYLLGELKGAERNEFEDHFFDCPVCAEEVRAGAIFEANARAVFADQARRSVVKPGWWQWVCLRPVDATAVACLVALLGAGLGYVAYQARSLSREVSELSAPQFYASFSLRGSTRSAGQVIELPRGSRLVGLSVDLPPGQVFGYHVGEILSESGATVTSVAPAKLPAVGTLNLWLPASGLAPGGKYTLVIRGLEDGTGKPAREIARYHFVTNFSASGG